MSEKKIRDRQFRVSPILASEALRLQARILKMVGGAVEHLPAIFAKDRAASPEAEAASNAAAIAAVTSIFEKADADEVVSLIRVVVETVQVKRPSGDWNTVDLDGDLSGKNMADLFPVVVMALREHFGDFFSAALANGKRVTTVKG